MSLVTDVQSVAFNGGSAVPVDLNVTEVEITASLDVAEAILDVPNSVQAVQVEVPGMRGEPGVKNVYVQANDPSIEFGWGEEQKDYVWIKT